MAKQDVKKYVIARLITLFKELSNGKDDAKISTETPVAIAEVKNMASNFGIKTKEIEKLEAEFSL